MMLTKCVFSCSVFNCAVCECVVAFESNVQRFLSNFVVLTNVKGLVLAHFAA